MQPEPTDDLAGKRKFWRIAFVTSLFLLALFWSVDSSIAYLLAGTCVFCAYMVLQNRKREPAFSDRNQQSYRPSFWENLKKLFNKNSGQRDPKRPLRMGRLIVLIFIGFVFLCILVPVLIVNESAESSTETLQKARELFNMQQYDSSAYYFRLAMKSEPDNPVLYLERGNAYLYANSFDSAYADYDRAIELNPEYKEAFYNKGLISYNQKQYTRGVTEVKQALEIDPGYTEAMLLLGDCFYYAGERDSALIWYNTAYQRGYRSAGLSQMIAYVHDYKGDTQRAISFYKEALSYDTTITEVYSRLGELLPGEDGNPYRLKAAQYQPR